MPLSTPRRSVYESKWQSRLGSDCGSRSSIVDGRGLRAAGRHFHFLRLDERQQPSIGSNDVRLLTAIKDNVSVLLAHPLPNTGNASHGAGHEDYRRSTIWNGEIVSVSSSRVSDARDSGNKDNRKYGRDDVFPRKVIFGLDSRVLSRSGWRLGRKWPMKSASITWVTLLVP